MLRAMLVEFPDDPASDMLDRQYMLGDALLVARSLPKTAPSTTISRRAAGRTF